MPTILDSPSFLPPSRKAAVRRSWNAVINRSFAAALVCLLQNPAAVSAESFTAPSTGTVKEVIKLTPEGLSPKRLTLAKRSGTVFFFNRMDKKPVRLEIEFGKKRVHCHTPNLALGDDGIMRTLRPIVPQDFELLCFPEEGVYPFLVREAGGGKTYAGEVAVDPN